MRERGHAGDRDEVEEQLGPARVPFGLGRRARAGRRPAHLVAAHELTVARGVTARADAARERPGSPLWPSMTRAPREVSPSPAPPHGHEDLDPPADRPPQPPPGRHVRRARSLALGVHLRRRRTGWVRRDRLALDGHRRARPPERLPGGVTARGRCGLRDGRAAATATGWVDAPTDALPKMGKSPDEPGSAPFIPSQAWTARSPSQPASSPPWSSRPAPCRCWARPPGARTSRPTAAATSCSPTSATPSTRCTCSTCRPARSGCCTPSTSSPRR